jgi:hypothetical protein
MVVENPEKESDLVDRLSFIYKEHLIAGEKTVRFFQENNNDILEISSALDKYIIPDSEFKNNYPFALSDDDLKKIEAGLHLVEVINLEKKTFLIFCSKRYISERIEIDPSDFKDLYLEGYTEIVGIKKYNKQFFDVVALDSVNSVIEIRLDVGNKISSDERKSGFNQIKTAFETLASELTSKDYKMGKVVNFFPAINALYRSKEGRVCELAFTTEGSSIKHEKMRRKNDCLRGEAYHQGGSKAVDGNIAAYRIAVTWEYAEPSTLKTQPELLLPGNSSMLSHPSSVLDEAIITHCAGTTDYDFVIEKLSSFLNQDESAD